jgi:tRNA-2-methylthio-N6-dimethylallyladenosine synthase
MGQEVLGNAVLATISGTEQTFCIRTFGCQMNDHDSDRMAQWLSFRGWKQVLTPREANLLIINSCSVRAKPEHKALSEAGRYKQAHKTRGLRIILAGCVAQQEGQCLLEKAPFVDAVLGPDAVERLPEIVEAIFSGRGPIVAVGEHDQGHPGFIPLAPGAGTALCASVIIMKGCDNFCSFCVVPYVRGREVSRPLADILDEVAVLAQRGCREITLLGQNVNSYCDSTGSDFVGLLTALDRKGAVERIRFTTSHPKDFDNKLIEAIFHCKRVCQHVHLPLQSGSNRILERMNRGYTRESYLKKALALRQKVFGVSVTSDLIVGFPSETDSDFQDTLELVKQVGFDQAFSFMYSPRPKTAAGMWLDDVQPSIKRARLQQLQALLSNLESASLARLVGSSQQVLVEGKSLRDPDALTGRTRCNRVVNFVSGSKPGIGKLVDVRILQARGHTLWGEAL